MKQLLLAGLLSLVASNAGAEVLCEEFPDPLEGWRDRWFAQNSDARNYYVCYSGGGENDRGNNPCALWICDGDLSPLNADVEFNLVFGATVTHFSIGIMPFVPCNLTVRDLGGNIVYQTPVVVDGTFPPCPTRTYECNTPTGLGSFHIEATSGSQVEGNTSIDNVCVTTGEPVSVEESTWGGIKALYR
ncbi:MAG: hypothetical protein ACRDGR_10120 [bacterium]